MLCGLKIFHMEISERAKGHICVLTTNLMFGVFIPISKYLMTDFASPLFVKMCRFIGATILFWTASFFIKDNKVAPKDLLWFLFFALTGIVFNQGLFIFALGLTSPVDASVILTATPFSAMAVAALLVGDPLTKRKLIALVVSLLGCVMVSGILGGDMTASWAGIGLGVLSVLCSRGRVSVRRGRCGFCFRRLAADLGRVRFLATFSSFWRRYRRRFIS